MTNSNNVRGGEGRYPECTRYEAADGEILNVRLVDTMKDTIVFTASDEGDRLCHTVSLDQWISKLAAAHSSHLSPQPCNYQTYAGEGNIDFCDLPHSHDDGIHEPRPENGITDEEIERKWAELNDDDGDIRIMAMLHELLQLRKPSHLSPEVSVFIIGENMQCGGSLDDKTASITFAANERGVELQGTPERLRDALSLGIELLGEMANARNELAAPPVVNPDSSHLSDSTDDEVRLRAEPATQGLPRCQFTESEAKRVFDGLDSVTDASLSCRERQLTLALELLREFRAADDCLTAEELCDKFSVIILRLNRSELLEAGK
jgi:hypothetical protein